MDLAEQFRLRDVDVNHPALQVAMPLVSVHDGELRCIGTAFPVMPGLAITAAHVAHDWESYQEQRDGYKRAGAAYAVSAFQWFEGHIYEWSVDETYGLGTADIAFLRFRRPGWWGDQPGQVRPRWARLSMNPPKPGDELRVFGFPSSSVENGILYVSPSESIARVRGVTMKNTLPFRPTSYVELDGEILGGMSGGPCFDSEWNVVGMASKGWDLLEDSATDSPLSVMALLWPAMSIPIDLFKTGNFPAWDLFKGGPAQALGHRRVHVTASGVVQLGAVDPDSLVPLALTEPAGYLEGALNFSAENARRALVEMRAVVESATAVAGPWDANALHRALRSYFWELDSALRLAMRLAAVRAGFPMDSPVEWERFVATWHEHGANAGVRDALGTLQFDWHGVALFEIRTYSQRTKEGMLSIVCAASVGTGRLVACMLDPCRRGGSQVNVPDGLERYFAAAQRFTHKLLRIGSGYKKAPSLNTEC
jgi:hypothetical protein